ncbi:MAG TPA: hypothetical protein VFH51_03160, partial [Myxococcota bacterium]|nr:hypothetical protein [Myxococcota bacterium]
EVTMQAYGVPLHDMGGPPWHVDDFPKFFRQHGFAVDDAAEPRVRACIRNAAWVLRPVGPDGA